MKNTLRLVTILFITAIMATAVAAQAELDVRIADVPEKVAAIDDALATYTKTQRHFTEGDATIFRLDGAVKKIVAELVSGDGKNRTEWISESYFADGKLIYVSDRFDRYDEREAKAPNAYKGPPPEKSYFYKGKLVLFLKGGKSVDWTKPEFDYREAQALAIVNYVLAQEN